MHELHWNVFVSIDCIQRRDVVKQLLPPWVHHMRIRDCAILINKLNVVHIVLLEARGEVHFVYLGSLGHVLEHP